MKKLLLLLLAAFTLNAHAQLNLDWSQTQSLSGGTFKSAPIAMLLHCDYAYATSNESNGLPGDQINGFITKYDADGNWHWNLTLAPAVELATFPKGGVGGMWAGTSCNVIVAYNTDSATIHLFQVDSHSMLVYDNILSGINNIYSGDVDQDGIYLFGQTPQTTCGAFQCNGVAVAKYDFDGNLVWKKTKYTSGGYFVDASDLSLLNSGNVIVCGKKAAYTGSGNDRDPFVLKYSSSGTLLWSKEFTDASSDLPGLLKISTDSSDNIYVAYTTSDIITSAKKCILKKLNAAGIVQFTKTINNSELRGLGYVDVSDISIISTSTGMKAYNSSGTLIWSNSIITDANGLIGESSDQSMIIGSNVNPLEPLKNYLVQLNTSTGNIIYQKDLSFSFSYDREMIGLTSSPDSGVVMLINDTIPPYGSRVTKLSPCSDFTYSFTASTVVTNVSLTDCNNGEITASWTGTFNSWPHIELYNSANVLQADINSPVGSTFTLFQNLSSGTYTVKVFDESCGEQVFNVTVKCPKPSAGFITTNITSASAKVNWNNAGCNDGYRVQYRLQGTIPWITTTTAINKKTLSGLNPSAIYEWKVATKCISSMPAVYSAYSPIQTFTTLPLRMGDSEMAIYNSGEIDLHIYPNPANEVLIAESEIENATMLKVKIVDVTGRELISFTEQAQGGMWQKEINLSGLSSGVYLLEIETGDGMIETGRFVKE